MVVCQIHAATGWICHSKALISMGNPFISLIRPMTGDNVHSECVLSCEQEQASHPRPRPRRKAVKSHTGTFSFIGT